MASSTHRIYHVLAKPPSFIGLTLDELGVLFGGGIMAMMMMFGNNPLIGLSLLGGSVFSVLSLKKFKKLSEGFSLKSYLYVHGLWPKPSKSYPAWSKREYAP